MIDEVCLEVDAEGRIKVSVPRVREGVEREAGERGAQSPKIQSLYHFK